MPETPATKQPVAFYDDVPGVQDAKDFRPTYESDDNGEPDRDRGQGGPWDATVGASGFQPENGTVTVNPDGSSTVPSHPSGKEPEAMPDFGAAEDPYAPTKGGIPHPSLNHQPIDAPWEDTNTLPSHVEPVVDPGVPPLTPAQEFADEIERDLAGADDDEIEIAVDDDGQPAVHPSMEGAGDPFADLDG